METDGDTRASAGSTAEPEEHVPGVDQDSSIETREDEGNGRGRAASPGPLWQFGHHSAAQDVAGSVSQAASVTPGQPFDPRNARSSKYVFEASKEINEYCETHFRRVMSDEERRDMLTTHPRPNTDVLNTPKVDESVTAWLGKKFPKTVDTKLAHVQTALQGAVGPLACAWSGIATQGDDPLIPAGEVLEVLQRTMVLLGHTNALLTQARRQIVLEAGDTEVAKLVKDDLPQEGKRLFGDSFTEVLTKRAKESTALQDASKLMHQPSASKQPFRGRGAGFSGNRQHYPQRHNFARNFSYQHRTNGAGRGNSQQNRFHPYERRRPFQTSRTTTTGKPSASSQ